jgi:hypothetical protein
LEQVIFTFDEARDGYFLLHVNQFQEETEPYLLGLLKNSAEEARTYFMPTAQAAAMSSDDIEDAHRLIKQTSFIHHNVEEKCQILHAKFCTRRSQNATFFFNVMINPARLLIMTQVPKDACPSGWHVDCVMRQEMSVPLAVADDLENTFR